MRSDSTLSQRLMYLGVSVVVTLLVWSIIQYWLTTLSFPAAYIHLIDIGIVTVTGITVTVTLVRRYHTRLWQTLQCVVTGITVTVTLVRLVARPIATRAGPTHTNTVNLLLQILGLGLVVLVLVILSGPSGSSFISALVGIGFFGIVIGLAAHVVLGNLSSGLMLLATRPFNINDRIAMITWQYGKFAPSISHGWLEPAYTDVVKGTTLTYTRILTDSSAILKAPNSIVTQSMIMNLSYGKQGTIATQFEVPTQIDPEQLRTDLNSALAQITEFKGGEDGFEIEEVSFSGYLVAQLQSVLKSRAKPKDR